MRNADDINDMSGSFNGKKQRHVGIRTFKKTSISPIINLNDYNVLKLPPITEDPQQTIEFLGEEVGKIFLRSKRKLKTVKNEFVLYDPMECGRIPKAAAYEILKRYKLPPNDNYQRKILAFFVTPEEPGKVDRVKLVDFLENSCLQYRKFVEMKQKEDDSLKPPVTPKADSTYGRYDSHTSNSLRDPTLSPRRGEAVSRQFNDRRDVGLSLEIEKAFKSSGLDPHVMIEQLEASIERTTMNQRQRDLRLVNNMHLKGLVAKTDFPINAALTMRCIERLDPYGNGEIEYPRFIEFLRKAVCSIPPSRDTRSQMSGITTTSSTTLSSGSAPWERHKPLGSIHRHPSNNGDLYPMITDNNNNINNNNNNVYLDVPTIRVEPNIVPTLHDLLDDDDQQNLYNTNDDVFDHNNNNNNNSQWDASLLSSTQDHRAGDQTSIFQEQPSIVDDEKEEKIQLLSTRGEVYKRVADALNDRAMLNNGLISTNDVRKTVNYYNMLFDADINLQKIIQKLDKHSKSDYVNVDFIIDSFSKGIL